MHKIECSNNSLEGWILLEMLIALSILSWVTAFLSKHSVDHIRLNHDLEVRINLDLGLRNSLINTQHYAGTTNYNLFSGKYSLSVTESCQRREAPLLETLDCQIQAQVIGSSSPSLSVNFTAFDGR